MYKNPITGIYRITSPTGAVYIGQSRNIKNRFTYHRSLCCKAYPKLFASLSEHGPKIHSFEIVHQLPIDVSNEILNEYERLYIQQHIDCGFEMLNMQSGGRDGKPSLESRKKMSESAKGNKSHLGHKFSPEVRAKMSEKRRQRIITAETRQKQSESMKKAHMLKRANNSFL